MGIKRHDPPEKRGRLLPRLCVATASLYLMAFSFALFLHAGLGSDCVSFLVDGLHKTFGLRQGAASYLINGALFLLALAFHRKVIGVSTLLSVVTTGGFLQLNLNFLTRLAPVESLPVWLLYLLPILAACLNALGIGFYLAMELGASPFDGTVLAIQKRTGWAYGACMYALNGVFFFAGLLLGGAWGYGTVVAVLLSGFLFQKVLPLTRKLAEPLLERFHNR